MVPVLPPFDIAAARRSERGRLLGLLRGLSADDWGRPTRCPGWSLLDLVVHLVGDDLGTLSWHRDGHRGSGPPPGVDETGFIDWLDDLQDGWVRGGRRISSRLAVDLLAWLDGPTADVVAGDDLTAVDAHVSWASAAPVPRWLDHGRDLTEYWLHRQQLLDALGRPVDDDPATVGRMLDILRWSLTHGLRHVTRSIGTELTVEVPDLDSLTWHLTCTGQGWQFAGGGSTPAAELTATAEQLWRLLTNNLEPERHGQPIATGDAELVASLLRTRAIIGHPTAASTR